MGKKLIGILAAIGVVVIIVLVALYKPKNNKDMGVLDTAIEASEARQDADAKAEKALLAPDSAAMDTTGR